MSTTPSVRPLAQVAVLAALVLTFSTAFYSGREAVREASTCKAPELLGGLEAEEEEEEEAGAGHSPLARWQAKGAPNEQFALIRSYPDRTFDERAYDAALESVRQEVAAAQRTAAPAAFTGPWRLEGPTNIGGRINTVAVHPTTPNTMYIGTTAGGLFKTTNGGTSWTPLFDSRTNLYISHIAFQPGTPNTMYVATGDPGMGSDSRVGDGLWKSTNGGTTWTNIGLNQMGVLAKVVVHPTTPTTLYVAAMGKLNTRDVNRGLYKSTNGGTTWTKVLNTGNQAGVIDLVMNPVAPSTLYCSVMPRIRTNTESLISGPEAKIYKSIDGGATWTVLTNGLPSGDHSRIGLAMPTAQPNTLYCSIIEPNPSLNLEGIWKTTNGGTSWTQVGAGSLAPNVVNGFGWYFEGVFVHPTNPNILYFGGVDLYKSTDGGQSWAMAGPPWYTYEVHADKHDLQFIGANTVVLGTDGGLYKSTDGGDNWTDIESLPITQFYRVAVNPHVPGEYWGGAQDNGTSRGNAASIDNWDRFRGGDGFQMRFDPTDPNLIYAETQNGDISAHDATGNYLADVTGTLDPADRRNWDMPYLLDPDDPTTLYTGTQRVWRLDGAPNGTWTPISPDLTDGLIYEPRFHNISALTVSAVNASNMYAGTSDANVWRSTNGGATWNNVTGSLPNRYVTCVRTSPNTANTVYVTHSGYKYNEFIPHLHKSTNNGTTWTDISGNLPNVGINSVLGYPGTDQILFVATDAGVYATKNGGTRWDRVGDMPVIPVYDLDLDLVNQRLVAGTFARSIQTFPLGTVTGVAPDARPELAVSLFPNPATERLTVALPAGLRATGLRILNLRGQLVTEPAAPTAAQPLTVDVRELRPGTYVLEVRTATGAVVRRRFVRG